MDKETLPTERPRTAASRIPRWAAVAAVGMLALTGCSTQPSDDTRTDSSPSERAVADDATSTLEQAEQAALEAVGEGQVTWSGPEDDRGAAWEIEITRSDGTEVDVLVAADGSVVKQVPRYVDTPVEGETSDDTTPSGEPITLERAEQAALEAVGEGRVTWSGPEDDRGAAWEIEVTRSDGTEVDVLVDAYGRIVQ